MVSKMVSQKRCWKDIMTKEMVTVISCGVTIGLLIRSGNSVKQPSFDYTNFFEEPFGPIDTLYEEPYCYAIFSLALSILFIKRPVVIKFDHTNSSAI